MFGGIHLERDCQLNHQVRSTTRLDGQDLNHGPTYTIGWVPTRTDRTPIGVDDNVYLIGSKAYTVNYKWFLSILRAQSKVNYSENGESLEVKSSKV